MRAVQSQQSRAPRLLIATLAALITMSWLALWQSGAWPYAHYVHHAIAHQPTDRNMLQSAAIFVGGWTVMSIAMMLPTSLPLIALFTIVVRDRPKRESLVLLACVGYLLVWTAAGVFAYALVAACREAAAHAGWPHRNPWFFGSAVCVIAGAFQFSSVKYACLNRCRSPLSFVTEHWSGLRARLDSLRLGLHHGLFCVGCCWALMLLMLLPGAGNLGWMLALAAVMAVEKNLSWGRAVVRPIGAALIAAGLVIAIEHLPPV